MFYLEVKRQWDRFYMPLQLGLFGNVTGQEERDSI